MIYTALTFQFIDIWKNFGDIDEKSFAFLGDDHFLRRNCEQGT